MVEVTKEKLEQAGSLKMMMVWRKIYNHLCRDCQVKIFRAGTDAKRVGGEVVANRMEEIIKNHICLDCKAMIDKTLKQAAKK